MLKSSWWAEPFEGWGQSFTKWFRPFITYWRVVREMTIMCKVEVTTRYTIFSVYEWCWWMMRHGILLSRRWRSCKSKKVAFNPFVWRYCGWKNNNEHGPVDPPVVPSSSYISLLQLACHTHVLLPLKIAWSLKNKIEIENGGSRKKQTEITQRRYNCPNGWNMGHTLASAFQRRVVKRSESFFAVSKCWRPLRHLST